VRKLAGGEEHRLRVGDWQVRFRRDVDSRQLVILRVLPRGRAYER
jgi:mRNA-degrading endonuclease RelE of RelBE toxin-antitoxin system